MICPSARTLIVSLLITGLPIFAQAPAERVDAPMQFPALVWEDGVGVASSPWRCSPEDWTQVALAAGAVVGTALILDHPIQRALQRHDSASLHRWADNLAPIGNTYSFVIAGGLFAAGYLGQDGEAQAAGADALSSLIVATAVLVPFKYGFGRATPADGEGNSSFKPFSSQDSFPSGHTTWAFTAAAAITEHYTEPWVQVTAYGLATLVGLARLEQNQHWTSDVLAGAILGTTLGKLVTRLNQRKRFGQQGQYQFTIDPQLGMGYQGVRMALKF
jgi:membrane-associated phospholipid phosphatase